MDFIDHVYHKIGQGVGSVADGAFTNPLKLYGRQLASTYGPGTAAAIVAFSTQKMIGNQTGRFVGTYIVAPLVVPAAMPFVATAGGFVFSTVVELVTQAAHKVLFKEKEPPPIDLSASDIVKEFEEISRESDRDKNEDKVEQDKPTLEALDDFEIIDIDGDVE